MVWLVIGWGCATVLTALFLMVGGERGRNETDSHRAETPDKGKPRW